MVSAILVFAIVIQAFFAIAVYKDAYARQDEEGFWAIVTLLFGVLGVLLYLIVRPDERVPEDERTSSELTLKMRTVAVYGIASVFGVIVCFIIALILAQTFYPMEIPDNCERLELVDDDEQVGPCSERLSHHQYKRNMQDNIVTTGIFSGFVLGPVSLYVFKQQRKFERPP